MATCKSDDEQKIPVDASRKESDDFSNAGDTAQSQVNYQYQGRKVVFDAIYQGELENCLKLKVKWRGSYFCGLLLRSESETWGSPNLVQKKQPSKKENKFSKRKQSASPGEKKRQETYFQRFPHTTVNPCNVVKSKLRSGKGGNSVGSTSRTLDDENNCLPRQKDNSNEKVTEKGLDQKNLWSDSIKNDSSDELQTPSCSSELMTEPYSLNFKGLKLKVKWRGISFRGVLLRSKRNGRGSPNLVQKKQPSKKENKFSKRKQSASPGEKKRQETYFQKFPHTTVNPCNVVKSKLRSGKGGNSVGSTSRTLDDENNCLPRQKDNSTKKVTEKALDQKNIWSDSIKNDSSDELQIPSCSYELKKEPYSPNVKGNSKRKGTYPVKESSPDSDNTLIYDLEDHLTQASVTDLNLSAENEDQNSSQCKSRDKL